jgi:hypothetical protein
LHYCDYYSLKFYYRPTAKPITPLSRAPLTLALDLWLLFPYYILCTHWYTSSATLSGKWPKLARSHVPRRAFRCFARPFFLCSRSLILSSNLRGALPAMAHSQWSISLPDTSSFPLALATSRGDLQASNYAGPINALQAQADLEIAQRNLTLCSPNTQREASMAGILLNFMSASVLKAVPGTQLAADALQHVQTLVQNTFGTKYGSVSQPRRVKVVESER